MNRTIPKDDTLAWLQSHRSEAKRIIEQWDPETESDTPKAARRDLQIIDGLLMRISKSGATEANGRTVEPLSRDEELSYTLSLAAQLEQEKAARLAAESALADLKEYAGKTFELWDKDQDSKVGKRLMWMSGTGNASYEPSLSHIHKFDLTAARETMRKASEWDACCKVVTDYLSGKPQTHSTLSGEIESLREERDTLRTERDGLKLDVKALESEVARLAEKCDRLTYMAGERDGLLAMVEQWREVLEVLSERAKAYSKYPGMWQRMIEVEQQGGSVAGWHMMGDKDERKYMTHVPAITLQKVLDVLALTPTSALAKLREDVRQQTLEEAAKHCEESDSYGMPSDKYCSEDWAAELRRMAEKEPT
jgi:hypothetical protein